jgi:hypothetical protein
MQLVRLSKPRSGAKYSPISYLFLPILGPYLSLAWETLGPLDWSQPLDELIPELVERGGADARFEGARDNLLNEQGVRQRRCRSTGAQRSASGLPQGATNYVTARGAKRLRDEVQKLRAANANSERIIELGRHLQLRAFSTRNVSRSSARAGQFQDGIRCM